MAGRIPRWRIGGHRPRIGLALGGGGARGLAHIGVLRVLEEAGIQVDILAGTSMGGLIAAAYACGRSPAELATEARKMSQVRNLVRLVNLTPGHRGLLHADHVREYLTEILGGGWTFDHLPVPLALSAVDLYQGTEVALTSGFVIEAAMATIAVPGLFPPVEREGMRLVDGGVMNNVPADLARRLGAEVVIAVEVGLCPERSVSGKIAYGPDVLSDLVPRFVWDLFQAEMIMISALSRQRLREARPQILLRPRIGAHVAVFTGFMHAEEVMAAGEATARAALPAIRRALQASPAPTLRRLLGRPWPV